MGQVIDALNNQTQTNLDDLNLNLDGGLDCNVDEVKSINQTNEFFLCFSIRSKSINFDYF